MLRTILKKAALFHGYTHFSKCIKRDSDDSDGILHQRFVDILIHGKYSMFDPDDMGDETKLYFRKILGDFIERYPFNAELFAVDEPATPVVSETSTAVETREGHARTSKKKSKKKTAKKKTTAKKATKKKTTKTASKKTTKKKKASG
jgi:hypothetical protein